MIARFQDFFEILRAGLRHSCHSPVPVARGAVMGLAQGVRASVASQGCCSAAVHCVSEGVVISELDGREQRAILQQLQTLRHAVDSPGFSPGSGT